MLEEDGNGACGMRIKAVWEICCPEWAKCLACGWGGGEGGGGGGVARRNGGGAATDGKPQQPGRFAPVVGLSPKAPDVAVNRRFHLAARSVWLVDFVYSFSLSACLFICGLLCLFVWLLPLVFGGGYWPAKLNCRRFCLCSVAASLLTL